MTDYKMDENSEFIVIWEETDGNTQDSIICGDLETALIEFGFQLGRLMTERGGFNWIQIQGPEAYGD